MIIVYTAPVVPLLRLELAHVFTLRTECHPENKCPLNPVVRSSGLILAFLKSQPETSTARRQHGAPSPTRRANTARRCGRLVAPLVAQSATKAEETPVRSGVVGGNVDGVHAAVGVNVAWNTHGTLIEQACTSALAAVWLDASLCSHAILLERPLRAGSMSIMDELLRAGSIFTWAAQ